MTEAQIRAAGAEWREGARLRLSRAALEPYSTESAQGWGFVDRLLWGVAVRGAGQRFFHPAVAGASSEPPGSEFVGDRRGLIEKLDEGYAVRISYGGSPESKTAQFLSYLEAERACVAALLDLPGAPQGLARVIVVDRP